MTSDMKQAIETLRHVYRDLTVITDDDRSRLSSDAVRVVLDSVRSRICDVGEYLDLSRQAQMQPPTDDINLDLF